MVTHLVLGEGEGDGVAADAALAMLSTANWSTASAAPRGAALRRLAGIAEPSELSGGTFDVLGGRGDLAAGHGCRTVLGRDVGDLPVVARPVQLDRRGLPVLGHRGRGVLAREPGEAGAPDGDSRARTVIAVGLRADRDRAGDE